MTTLQWGGRFARAPDEALLAFGSSLEEDLVLAPFDVQCSLAHVEALRGAVLDDARCNDLGRALHAVAAEISAGTFAEYARASGAEDVHGAIDARVRELAADAGEWLHAGRSRNDQVATTLLLYARDRAQRGASRAAAIASALVRRGRAEFDAGTIVAACTHRQPAQPVLLAFVLAAWSEPFARAAKRFRAIAVDAVRSCPLGSAALAGSTLPLGRAARGKRARLRRAFTERARRDWQSRRYAGPRARERALRPRCIACRRGADRMVGARLWLCAHRRRRRDRLEPHAAETQSRSVRVGARARRELIGAYAGALATLHGLAPSYQRDLQETKAQAISIVEDALATLAAFERALSAVEFARGRMNATALDGYTVATDVADALIANGIPARAAHALVGGAVAQAEAEGRPLAQSDLTLMAAQAGLERLDAPLDARASVHAKRTCGSTAPDAVCEQLASLAEELAALGVSE